MRSHPALALLFLVVSAFVLNACQPAGTEQSVDPAPAGNDERSNAAPGDDVVELAKIINLPFEPEESAVWRESGVAADGTNGDASHSRKKLTAVLKFSPREADEITRNAERQGAPVPAEIDAEDWFPAELVARSQVSGGGVLRGNSYAAGEFIKAPFTGGKLIRVEDSDYFVLELTTN